MMNTLELKEQKMVERCQNQTDAGCHFGSLIWTEGVFTRRGVGTVGLLGALFRRGPRIFKIATSGPQGYHICKLNQTTSALHTALTPVFDTARWAVATHLASKTCLRDVPKCRAAGGSRTCS